ncbi:MAG TPA: FtsX-like permease family protein, partial [Candidatus Acidoferrum sp.]|nr:FtsX-like permease family protein [Candidatus Acidoferrum sp.]
HLQVGFDSRIDPTTLARTPSLIGASAYGGPYPATALQFQSSGHKYSLTAYGRNDPGGAVEQLRVSAGRWPAADNEIALALSYANLNHISVGDRIKVVSVPQAPVLTVVALIVDIDEVRADVGGGRAWVLGAAIGPLTTQDSSFLMMDYRFAADPTSAQLQAVTDKLRASLPQGSIVNSTSYLLLRSIFNVPDLVLTGVLTAFSLLALAATAAIVANLVTGIVISSYREIGIMKAVGFTPLQVGGVFVLQVLIPSAAACLIGIPAGTILSQPLLANSSSALGVAYQASYSPALDLLALGGALLIVTVAALIPALRAGLLKPAIVIANATAPRGQSGRWLRRLASRVGLPRSISLGLGDAVARPVRAFLTVIAIFAGVATMVAALGETRSFAAVYGYEGHVGHVDVTVKKSPALADSDAMRLFSSQPETERVVSQTAATITVPGISDPVSADIFRGDSSSLGYLLTAGRWMQVPGDVVAPRGLVQDAHLKLGDTFTSTFRGAALTLRIVGEVYDFTSGPGGHQLFLDWSTVAPVAPELNPSGYLITLMPGSNVDAYVTRLAAAQPDLLDVQAANSGNTALLATIGAVMFAIAGLIALIAVAGIFNTVLLSTRERVRETATLKALGMSPRQVIAMVAASAGFLALLAGLAAVPAGVALYRQLFDLLSNLGGDDTPAALYDVFAPWELVAMPLAGMAIAVLAALIPGRWAARTNVVEVLHAE